MKTKKNRHTKITETKQKAHLDSKFTKKSAAAVFRSSHSQYFVLRPISKLKRKLDDDPKCQSNCPFGQSTFDVFTCRKTVRHHHNEFKLSLFPGKWRLFFVFFGRASKPIQRRIRPGSEDEEGATAIFLSHLRHCGIC